MMNGLQSYAGVTSEDVGARSRSCDLESGQGRQESQRHGYYATIAVSTTILLYLACLVSLPMW